jgi:hypothetical protein
MNKKGLKSGSKRAITWLLSQIGTIAILTRVIITGQLNLNFVYIVVILQVVGLVCLGLLDLEDLLKTLKEVKE